MRRLAWLVFPTVMLPLSICRAQTSYPMIARIEPTAIRRGTTAEVTIAGVGDFSGASALLVEGRGISAEPLAAKADDRAAAKAKGSRGRASGSATFKVAAAEDAAPGVREVRVATPQGVSSVGLIVVVDDPVVAEADDKANNTAAGAQKLATPAVVSGKIGAIEDVDTYAIEAKAGQTIAFSLLGNRLENKIHDLQMHLDPILTLADARGRELASDDNHDFADPRLIHTFAAAGTYYLQVRDTNYGGNASWTYVLRASSGPLVTSIFPMAANPAKAATMAGEGVNFDRSKPITLDLPADARPGVGEYPLATDRGRSAPVPVVVTPLPVVREEADTVEGVTRAQSVKLPAAVCGRLGAKNDVDTYRFAARKGTAYAFEVVARRAGSAVDPVLRVLDKAGKALTEADDSPGMGKDARVEWTAPADGDFAVQVGDLHNRGGDEAGYVILAEAARPDFVATCDPDKLNVGPGSRTTTYVKVERRAGFDGPVTFAFEGLPPGVSASPLTVPSAMTQGVVVVSAAADAKPSAALVGLRAKAETKTGPVSHEVGPIQEIYLPGGGRGLYAVETMAVAVTKPSDIAVEAKPAEITLKPGGTATIDVAVTRQGGYAGPVNLAVDLAHLGRVYASPLPKGVKLVDKGSKTLLGPKDTAGKIVLQASPDAAPCDRVPIAVMGHVSINFVVKTAYSSAPILVTIPAKVDSTK